MMTDQSYSLNANHYFNNTGNSNENLVSQSSFYDTWYQTSGTYEERSCWRKLYDYNSGYWYYQNLLNNTTQWEKPDGWDLWPINGAQTPNDEDKDSKSCLSIFRKTSEELEQKNQEYVKRKARRQVNPEEAKNLHWRPEGANEYNIWYDKWIGDHWKGMKDDGMITFKHSNDGMKGYERIIMSLF